MDKVSKLAENIFSGVAIHPHGNGPLDPDLFSGGDQRIAL
jgi:hypothetical protein